MAARFPTTFAAVVPIAGGGDPNQLAANLVDQDIWAFHGNADNIVSVGWSRQMVRGIRALGGSKIRYTEYDGVGHVGSWERAYADRDMVDWMFAKRR